HAAAPSALHALSLHDALPISCLAPSTPNGGLALLDHYGIPMNGARAVVIGRSNVVGRPLAALLQRRNATVTVCHSGTRDLASYTDRKSTRLNSSHVKISYAVF